MMNEGQSGKHNSGERLLKIESGAPFLPRDEPLRQRKPQIIPHQPPVPFQVVVAPDDDDSVAFAQPAGDCIEEL